MDQPDNSRSVGWAMRVIYPALLVGWLAFPGHVRDWAQDQVVQGWMPQWVMPVCDAVQSASLALGLSPLMQDWHDRINARLDQPIR